MLEDAFQIAFQDQAQLFVKSTGDGLMLVSEAAWFDANNLTIQPDHARRFCEACAKTLQVAMKAMTGELAIGCGITTGEVTRLHLLGRLDYIGPAVNAASKIQAVAYNELVIDEAVAKHIDAKGRLLQGKGFRVSAEEIDH